ncbi:MAG: efflux RND transporter permease subunit, partial [Prevotellaceae bacterium]|nr:efflux RND transporter permease subunit [Prevotellaceae bacterium]
ILLRPNDEGKAKKNLNYYTKLAYEASYNAVASKYKKSIGKFIGRTKTVWILLVASCLLLAFFMKSLPNGLVPQEDQGVILAEIRTAPGYTLQQTDAVLDKVEAKIKKIPELQSYVRVAGYGMVSGGGSSYGTFVVRLKPWDDRKGINHMIDLVIARLYYDCEDIKEAVVLPFQMPQIPGYGTSNDIELVLQDQQGGDMSVFYGHAQKFLAELQKRKEVSAALSSYSESFPKYKAEINATQCDISGISPQQVLNTLGSYCGGAFIGNYNQFGKVYRIIANAAPEYRLDPTSLSNMFVKVGNGSMAPLSQFVTLVPAVGSSTQRRFNLFQSITCSVTPAEGFSDGDVQNAIAEVAEEVMPAGYGYEYGGMSRELAENSKGNMTGIIYGICIFLIYLILGCLYESWLIPLAVLFSVPFGLMGSFGVSYLLGLENNIYLQTGVIMLIGLLAKTAILITEFAVARHKQGLSIVDAALQAAEERLRPILMTVACMVIGMIPLIVAGGAGANGNRSLAIGVTGGMIVGTIALVYVVPVFYIIFQKLQEKVSGPIKEDDNEEE